MRRTCATPRTAARAALCLALASPYPPMLAAATLTEHMDIACEQQGPGLLRCSYRLLEGGQLDTAVAEHAGTVIPARKLRRFPHDDDSTALLVLVDTSDPARQPVIDQVRRHLEELLAAAAAHHRIGLAAFDADLHVLTPLGSSPAQVREAASSLAARGKTTELYRNVREAVRLLARAPDARKVLLLMSDGQAEDLAYHHEDVVAAARAHGVIIHGVGYPRSVTRAVALQTLRRLSDETGGHYVQASHVDFSLPRGVFARMLGAADSGGELEFDLGPLQARGAGGAIDLSLTFQANAHSVLVIAPIRLPAAAPPGDGPLQPLAAADASPRSAPPPSAARPLPAPSPAANLRTTVLLIALALTLAASVYAIQRQRRLPPLPPARGQRPALAYLVRSDPDRTRHTVDKTPWRIGRGRNNDLILSDHSVSRLHAEIRSNDEGQLLINDLDALNGVFVNDERIASIQLREGDVVDIGDVRMQFTLHDESYASQEATVLVRTRTPV